MRAEADVRAAIVRDLGCRDILEIGSGPGHYTLNYPGDRPYREVSRAKFRDQTLVLFQSAWLAIIEDGKLLDVARVD